MIKLWNQTMPHRCVEDAFEPYLTPYDCDAAKTAIVVCPGGAYCGRADYEGNLETSGLILEYSCQCSSQISGRKAVSKRRSFGIISSQLVWLRR